MNYTNMHSNNINVIVNKSKQTPTSTNNSTISSTSTSNSLSGFAFCINCQEYGVKAAFYGKSKLYCSVACQSGIKKSQAVKRTYDSAFNNFINHNIITPQIQIANTHATIIQSTNQLNDSIPGSIYTPISDLKLNTNKTIQKPIQNNIKSNEQLSQQSTQNANKFFWSHYLENEKAEAAPVTAFKHAPLCDFWNKITIDIKVEVPNRIPNCNDDGQLCYWFASVLKFAGYLAKLRYIGYEDNDKYDFWLNLCDSKIHPVGWSAENDIPLVPPKDLLESIDDWKGYLMKTLVGCKTLPKKFHQLVQESLKSRFRCGMLLELIDKKKISRMKVSRIISNIGGRLRMKYENCEDFDDFWCHQDSELIHPIGWSVLHDHDIEADEAYKKNSLYKITNGIYESNECTPEMFKKPRELTAEQLLKQFRPLMKLEAIDPLNLSTICVASITKVLKNNYLMISIDGYKTDDGFDMFCYHRTSSSLFPAGFCQQNNIPLQAPYDYKSEFNWENYLRETKSEFAPVELFYTNNSIENPFKIGMKLESVDLMEPRMVCVATVASVFNRLIKLNFDGWESEFDQWVDFESCDIYPVGWCEFVNYPLEPPRKPDYDPQNGKKKTRKTKRTLKK